MNERPLVTVLMPCYNAMPFLPAAMDSIVNQTYTNLEILCIDDGSTDDTGKVLQSYAERDPRIRIVKNEENLRLIRSLNKGIDLANGEYIARMDADDITDLKRIEIEVDFMHLNPNVDIVSTGSYKMSEDGVVYSKNILRQFNTHSCFYASFFYVPIGHPELLIKTEVLKNNKFLFKDHVLHTEDYELWSRLLRLGYNLCNMNSYLHYFRINSQSVSRKYTDIQDKNFIECAKNHYNAYADLNYTNDIVMILVNRFGKDVTADRLKRSIHEMKTFKAFFISKENIKDKVILKEIDLVYSTQLFDICFQAIKKSNFRVKIYSLWVLTLNGGIFFKTKVLKYLLNKLK